MWIVWQGVHQQQQSQGTYCFILREKTCCLKFVTFVCTRMHTWVSAQIWDKGSRAVCTETCFENMSLCAKITNYKIEWLWNAIKACLFIFSPNEIAILVVGAPDPSAHHLFLSAPPAGWTTTTTALLLQATSMHVCHTFFLQVQHTWRQPLQSAGGSPWRYFKLLLKKKKIPSSSPILKIGKSSLM